MAKMLKWDLMTPNLSSCQWEGMVGSNLKEVWDLGATVIWLWGTAEGGGGGGQWVGKKDVLTLMAQLAKIRAEND